MKTMKGRAGIASILIHTLTTASTLLLLASTATAFGQAIQIGNLQIPLSAVQSLESNAPDAGTFYLVKDVLDWGGFNTAAPCPDNCAPGFPVYSLGIEGLFLVDNSGISDETIDQILAPLLTTNEPPASPIDWPVSLDGLSLVDLADVPEFGTFYLYQDQFDTNQFYPPNPPPYPAVPEFAQWAPVYALSTNDQFLIDDTGLTRPESGPVEEYVALNYGTNLALRLFGPTNYMAYLVLTNTVPGTNYDIEYKLSLADPAWEYAGTIPGDPDTNTTVVPIPVGTLSSIFFRAKVSVPQPELFLQIPPGGFTPGQLTVVLWNTIPGEPYEIVTSPELSAPLGTWTVAQSVAGAAGGSTTAQFPVSGQASLFVCGRYAGDSDGNGIPDWWELKYFGYVGIDPFAFDPSGDGWSYLEDYQNGFVPGTFNTPPTPTGLVARYNGSATDVRVTWNPSPGNLNGYSLERSIPELQTLDTFTLPADATSFEDNPFPLPNPNPQAYPPKYTLVAHYNTQFDSPPASATLYAKVVLAELLRGPEGRTYVAIPIGSLPKDTAGVRLTIFDISTHEVLTNFDVSLSDFTNGIFRIPDAWAPPLQPEKSWRFDTLDSEGNIKRDLGWGWDFSIPFFDGREQLKENLLFVMRAANRSNAFEFVLGSRDDNRIYNWKLFRGSTNYLCSGFLFQGEVVGNDAFPWQYEYGPFIYNHLYRNFVFSLADVDTSGRLTTGMHTHLSGSSSPLQLVYPPRYLFQWPTDITPIGSVLSPSVSQWTFFQPFAIVEPADRALLGLSISGGQLWLAPNATNLYGLQYLGDVLAIGNVPNEVATLNAGGSVASAWFVAYVYPQAAQPQLQTVDYYFAPRSSTLLPGRPDFSITNSTPLMIVPIGNPNFAVAGFAKQVLLNGAPNKYAFLAQYFDKAYLTNPDGTRSTNETGVLSEYGEFFPTDAGRVILTTKPDLTQANDLQGECTVHVIKLQLDVNHDGTMDLSYGGPDNTSSAAPMAWWINSDNDGEGIVGADTKTNKANPADSLYGEIRSWRNLEDFARLWVCGLPKLPTTNGYTITLTMVPSSGTPAINLYRSYDTNDGAAYLSDTNAAIRQFTKQYLNDQLVFDFAEKLATISSGQSYTLPVGTDGTPSFTNFLFEGAAAGMGELTLTILQGSTVIASSSAWLDLHDVKDFYERATITNIMSEAKSNWSSTVQAVKYAQSSALGEDTNLIVLIHGINVSFENWLAQSDTVFKRLYWAGYRGKFATVKWPCEFLNPKDIALSLDLSVFNRSEFKAYKSGTAFAAYLADVRARFPGYQLHLLAHSQGNSVVSEAIRQSGASFDTYILSQGALPASAYDVNAPTDSKLLWWESLPEGHTPEWQPMGYRGIYANFTGRLVNFYNANDPVLRIWLADQAAGKPDGISRNQFFPSVFYDYDGVNGWCHNWILSAYLVTDPQESRAMISRSRTESIGRSGPESPHGAISSAVNLNTRYGFNDAFPGDHSAQWAWPIQGTLPYFRQVLLQTQPGQ